MKSRSVLSVAALVLGVLVFSPLPIAYAANPTSAELSFTYNVNTGLLRISHEFNRNPDKVCRVTVRGLIAYEGLNSAASVRSIKTRAVTKSRLLKFRAYNLPGVAKDGNQLDPILTLQARSTCGNTTIVSNATARYVTCGLGSVGVSPGTFLKLVAKRIVR